MRAVQAMAQVAQARYLDLLQRVPQRAETPLGGRIEVQLKGGDHASASGRGLAGWAPVQVAPGEPAGAYLVAADEARLAGAAVDVHLAAVSVDPRRAPHRLRCMCTVDGVDAALLDALAHEQPQVDPDPVPLVFGDVPTRTGRWNAGAEQHLVGVDDAGTGHNGLVEQPRGDRLGAAADPGVRGVRVGVVP